MATVDEDFAAQQERQRQDGIAASLKQAAFDQDLYGSGTDRFAGYESSIGVADTEEEMDAREQAVKR